MGEWLPVESGARVLSIAPADGTLAPFPVAYRVLFETLNLTAYLAYEPKAILAAARPAMNGSKTG